MLTAHIHSPFTMPSGEVTIEMKQRFIPADENTPEFAYHSLILRGQIGGIFYVYAPEGLSSDDCYVYFDVSGDKSQNT